jgi:Domain of unknown function (DUF1963)
MARPGFRLDRPAPGAEATGRCRLGGPALLEPGTPWPERSGVPLSLYAVLDTDALAPWLGAELPVRPGLLNFFHLDPDLPYEVCRAPDMLTSGASRVIPAGPSRATETPAPARRYPAVPVPAAAVTMLPDSWDVEDDDVESDRAQRPHHGRLPAHRKHQRPRISPGPLVCAHSAGFEPATF